MLLALAEIKAKPGKRDEIVKLAAPCIAASRQEAGVLSYRLYVSAENDVTIQFIEKYVDKDALRSHAKSDHLKAFAAAIAPYQDGDMVIDSYIVPDQK